MPKKDQHPCCGFSNGNTTGLKRIPYRGQSFDHGEHDGILDYALLPGNRCVFSGITRTPAKSTVNAAEDIILNICGRERVDPCNLQFFDLQTCRGYDFRLEQYAYSELILKFGLRGSIQDVRWDCTDCPPDVLELFRGHIGEIVIPVLSHEDALAQGFGPETAYMKFESAEAALSNVRKFRRPTPAEQSCLAIVDLSTASGFQVEDQQRYELRIRTPERR
jgi:hypothetical protein